MISRDLVDNIKAAVNLVDLVSEYVEVYPAGFNLWQSRCPHPDHNDETPSFRIKLNDNGFYSWFCGGCHCGPKNLEDKNNKNYGSDCFAFIMWMSDFKGSKHVYSWYEAVKILAKRVNIPIEEDKNGFKYKILKNIAEADNSALLKSKKALSYLYSRGLDNSDIQKWMIGISSLPEGYDKNIITRVSFPLFTRYNQIVGFSKRKLPAETNENIPKYWNSKNSEIFCKSSYLYGLNNYDSSFPELRITEGVMDVVTASKFEVINPVATLGTAFTKEHASLIKKLNVSVCFCLDGDAAGQKGIRRSIEILAAEGIYAKVFIIPDEMDLAELSLKLKDKTEEFIEEHSMTYWEYCLAETVSTYESQLTELRKKCMPNILKACKGVTSEEDDILMKSYVKERFGVCL